jgi:nucleoside-diphosphate-sugar epimerase
VAPELPAPPPGAVLVTGVTGLIGRQVVADLLARGCEVRGAVRRELPGPLRSGGLRCVRVDDIGPDTDWREALAGAGSVVHAAAHVHVMRPGPADDLAYRRVNVEGTRTLAEQAARAGVRRLVFLSSIKVNGEATPNGPFTAADPPAPQDAFGRCKADAEAALREVCGRHGLEIVVIRPPVVYGPGVRGNFGRLIRFVERGWPLPFAAVENRRSLISVWNLADLVALALAHAAAPGRTWLACDGEDVSTPELIRRIAAALDRKPRLWSVPPALLLAAAAALGRRDEALRLTGSLFVDASSTVRDLGWHPRLSLDEGLRRTVAAPAVEQGHAG